MVQFDEQSRSLTNCTLIQKEQFHELLFCLICLICLVNVNFLRTQTCMFAAVLLVAQ